MKLSEYTSLDGLGLAELIAKRQVSPKEVAQTAARAIDQSRLEKPADS